jgi:hypothetical protein
VSKHTSTRSEQLQKARRIRSKMHLEKQRLASGDIHVVSVLEDPKAFSLGRLNVFALLRCAPGLSDKGAKKILLSAKIWPLDRVRDIDLYLREEIIRDLPPRARQK